MADRFYIGQVDGDGVNTSLRPYALPDNAFSEMLNAYVFRGRVRKRFGAQLMQGTTAQISGLEQIQSRLKINIGTTNGAGTLAGTAPGATWAIGQAFSCGNEFFTVYQANGDMLKTGSATTYTYNTATGAYNIVGSNANTVVYFYPATPVMGIGTYEQPEVNDEEVIAFDTQFAYTFAANGWERLSAEATAGAATWTGSNSNFFWTTNWRGATDDDIYFFVSNYNTAATLTGSDRMRYYDGTQWNFFSPRFDSTAPANESFVLSARIIVPFKDRLLLLNTVENTGAAPGTNATYVNRCRFSWIGDPTAAQAFYDNTYDGGDYIDAPTKEAIVTAQFLKDRLIVFFESSTWELVFNGNQIQPFSWQKINTELGAESTFSQVPFDKVVLGVGNVGIHQCSGYNVDRIDSKIPQTVFQIHNSNEGPQRVYGIRDYYTEMVYWSFPDATRSATFPFNNRVLTYNYKSDTWAFNEDSITCFGYFQTPSGATWGTGLTPWLTGTGAWGTATNLSGFRNVIAGNQEGYTFIINAELSANCPALQITNMTYVSGFTATLKVYNHNLSQNDYVKVVNCQGVTSLNDQIFKVDSVTDANTIVLNTFGTTITGTYTGGGTLTRITTPEFKTKQFNFYADQGRNAYISKVDFLVERTIAGQCVVDFLISSSDYPMLLQSASTSSIVGSSVLETSPYALIPFEAQQARLWHPVYFLAEGEYVQFYFYFNDTQKKTVNIAEADFQLHAMIINSKMTSSRLQ